MSDNNENNKHFTHLSSDTNFPGLPEKFKYANEFNYNEWAKESVVRLHNVKWNSNNENVVYFETEKARDDYFDNKVFEKITLDTKMELLPNGTIRLPFTFLSASHFNYLEVIFPDMPVPEEYSFNRKRFYYFIQDIDYLSPSTTEFVLKLDTWTTFINSCEIKFLNLDRGHFPVSKIDAEKYLENPLKNNKYLLAEDYDVDNTDIIPFQYLKVINDTDTYVCFAISGDMSGSWGNIHTDSWQIPQKSNWISQGVPNNLCCYAIKSIDYVGFMNYMFSNIPQWYRTLKGIYLIPGALLSLSQSFQVGSITCWYCEARQNELFNIKLKVDDFNYPEEYKKLAKLYTSPYAYIQIGNQNGDDKIIKIENTNNSLKALSNLNIAFPFINLEVLFKGIGSDKDLSASFTNLDNRSFAYNGKWADYLIKFDIPVYAVNPHPYYEYDIDNYWDIQDLLKTAEVVYNNDVDTQNMQRTNQIRTANTNKANADRDGALAQFNANTSAQASIDNTDTENSYMATVINLGINYNQEWTDNHNNMLWKNTDAATTLTTESANEEIKKEVAQGVAGLAGNVAQTAANLLGDELSIAGAVVGTNPSGVGAGMGAYVKDGMAGLVGSGTIVVNTITSVNCLKNVAQLSKTAAEHQFHNAEGFNNIAYSMANDLNFNKGFLRRETNATVTSRTARATNDIGSQTNYTISSNGSATQSAMTNNANNEADTEINNAQRTYNLALAKAHYKENSWKITKVRTYGDYKGDNALTQKPMSIFYNLITKSESAISEIGDIFCRYGYRLNQNITFETFNVMKYFSYWKVNDIWIYGKDKMFNDKHRNDIINILKNGVTVWKNPDEIGRVSIYEN